MKGAEGAEQGRGHSSWLSNGSVIVSQDSRFSLTFQLAFRLSPRKTIFVFIQIFWLVLTCWILFGYLHWSRTTKSRDPICLQVLEKIMIFIYFINMFDEICVRQQRIQVSLKCFLLILQVKNRANTNTRPRSQKNVKWSHHLTQHLKVRLQKI